MIQLGRVPNRIDLLTHGELGVSARRIRGQCANHDTHPD